MTINLHIGKSCNYLPFERNSICNFVVTLRPEQVLAEKIQCGAIGIVLDMSGSMKSRANIARAALCYILDNVTDDCLLSVILFNDNPIPITAGFVPAGQVIDQIKQHAYYPAGNTNIAGALNAMFVQLEHVTSPAEIILLTDGFNNRGPALDTLSNKIKELARDKFIAINTVTIGSEPEAEAIEYIAALSAGGIYFHIEDINNIAQVAGGLVCNLKSIAATHTTLEINLCGGARLSVTHDTVHELTPKKATYILGNIYSKHSFLLPINIKNYPNIVGDLHRLCDITLKYNSAGQQHTVKTFIEINRATEIPPDYDTELVTQEMYILMRQMYKTVSKLYAGHDFKNIDQVLNETSTDLLLYSNHPDRNVAYLCRGFFSELEQLREQIRDDEHMKNSLVNLAAMHAGNGGYMTGDQQKEVSEAAEIIARYTYLN